MTRIAGIAGILVFGGLMATQADAQDYGRFSLKPRETQQLGATAPPRELRVCNDYGSGGTLSVAVGAHEPLAVQPGLCIYDLNGVIIATNEGSGVATGSWGFSQGHNGNDRMERFRTR
jgi:hypothetical protein